MPDLRPGQYKRIGRISEKNPERALAVSERMEKRASREERGKEFVKDKPAREKIKSDFAQGVARLYDGGGKSLLRGEENPRAKKDAVKKITSRDIPLAPTPEPLFSRR
jgi:hypothetical protein